MSFENYYNQVLIRNSETHEDGHLIVFQYSETVLKSHVEYFRDCWKSQLSPYKALTFLEMENNEQRYGN